MSKKKAQINWNDLEGLGAQIMAYEFAICSLLEVLAKTQPGTALQVAQAMQESIDKTAPELDFVKKKARQYVDLIRSNAKISH